MQKTDGWKVLALNNEHVTWRTCSSSFSSFDFVKNQKRKKKKTDCNPGKREGGENKMLPQIACLLLKYDVFITTFDGGTAGFVALWSRGFVDKRRFLPLKKATDFLALPRLLRVS